MHSPIRIETVADLIARKHTLGLYCWHCDRWAEAPLERLAASGFADRPILRLNFRCAVAARPPSDSCGRPRCFQRRATGWMEPLAPAAPTTAASTINERLPRPRVDAAQADGAAFRGTISWNIERDFIYYFQ